MKLELRKLTKKYGKKVALSDINVVLEQGVYAILGANGAGKSTLMNLITDNVSRTSGDILYNGREIRKMGAAFRSKLGYMPQQQGYYEQFSARAFLLYMASLKGLKGKRAAAEVDRLLEVVNLSEESHIKMEKYSGGMKQRALLAQALLGNPDILILDEPTAGLDPRERIRMRNYISELSADKIILFATHVVSDIECIADRVLLMRNGKLLKTGTPGELISSMEGKVGEMTCTKQELEQIREQYKISNIIQKKDGLSVRVTGDELPEGFVSVSEDVNLEDVFLYYSEGA